MLYFQLEGSDKKRAEIDGLCVCVCLCHRHRFTILSLYGPQYFSFILFYLIVIHLSVLFFFQFFFLSPVAPCKTTRQVSLTVIGMGQYKIPPVVLRIISVSEININLLGVPRRCWQLRSAAHSIRETERERKDGWSCSLFLFCTLQYDLKQGKQQRQRSGLI